MALEYQRVELSTSLCMRDAANTIHDMQSGTTKIRPFDVRRAI